MKRFNVTNLYYLANMKYPILAVMAILITSCGSHRTERARPVDSVVTSILNPNRSLGFLCVVRQREIL